MTKTNFPFYFKSLTAGLFLSCAAVAGNAYQPVEKDAIHTIQELYHRLQAEPMPSMSKRIVWFSGQFIGAPYLLGALGEGSNARFDQGPAFRTNAFDCETYVTTILALSLGNSVEGFEHCLLKLRYKNGKKSYLNRNHFTSLDWNQNNQSNGFLKDITLEITDKNQQPIAKMAKAIINKPAWYQHKTLNNIRLLNGTEEEKKQRLAELKTLGKTLPISKVNTPYLPLTRLFNKKGEPDLHIFSQIPDGSIIEIVRPGWDLRKTIGTCLNISHLGFAIWSGKTLYLRDASSTKQKIIDTPLIPYLKETLESPTIRGINIQIVREKPPSSC